MRRAVCLLIKPLLWCTAPSLQREDWLFERHDSPINYSTIANVPQKRCH